MATNPNRKRKIDLSPSSDKENNLRNGGSRVKQAKLTDFPQASNDAVNHTKTTSRKAQKPSQPKPKSKPSSKPNASKAATKPYNDALKAIDKRFKTLLKRYKPNPTIWSGVTSDDFAAAMAKFLPTVDKILDSGAAEAPKLAFNLLMVMGEHSYGDLEACCKSSGWGETDEPFQEIDAKMVEVIGRRLEREGSGLGNAEEVEVEAEPESELKAIMSLVEGKSRPNKQERGWIEKARRNDLLAGFEWRQQRRQEARDWVGIALEELRETRKEIDRYGIGVHFFTKSIERLEGAKGGSNEQVDEA